jgi:opacity protein-like surface antigen
MASGFLILKDGRCLVVFFMILSFTIPSLAQQTGTVEVRGSAGVAAFLDEDDDHSSAWGAAVRAYVTPRISLEPEFYYLRGYGRSAGEGAVRDYEFNLNVSLDFLKTQRITPYVFGGVGFQLHRNRFEFGNVEFQIKETRESFGGGIGGRIFLTDRLFIAPEVRLGWETLARVVASIGYRF